MIHLKESLKTNIRVVRRLWEATMKYDIDKNGIIMRIGNKYNQFINTIEPNLNIYFNEIMKFYEPFAILIVKKKTGFYLQD